MIRLNGEDASESGENRCGGAGNMPSELKSVLGSILGGKCSVDVISMGDSGCDGLLQEMIPDWLSDESGTNNFPQVNWTAEATVLLRGGTVELIIGRPEDGPQPLGDAINNENYGWEIESEIGDLIHDIIYAEELILPALGASISVDQSYE